MQSFDKLHTISGVFTTPKTLIFVIFISLCWLSACKEYDNTNINTNSNAVTANQAVNAENKSTQPKDDAVELGKIINLPFAPEEAVFREDMPAAQANINHPTARKVTAVLKFSEEDAQKIIKQAETYRPAEQAVVSTEDWFPAELIAQSQLSGDETLKGTAYAAKDFFLQPYSNGRIARINDTDYFVLELSTN